MEEPEDNTPQTAEEIVSASLLSGSLTDVCDISVSMQSINTEEELVKTFAVHGCTCEFGTPCCISFLADHYLMVHGALAEVEADLLVMGQIMAHCFLSSSAYLFFSTTWGLREGMSSIAYKCLV